VALITAEQLVPVSFVGGGNDGTKLIPQGKNGIKTLSPFPVRRSLIRRPGNSGD
jgi:hypothetical protein